MKKDSVPQLGFDFGEAHLPLAFDVIFDAFADYWPKVLNVHDWLGNIAFLEIDNNEFKQSFIAKISDAEYNIIDIDNIDDLRLLEIFYDSEKHGVYSLLVGNNREINQADLKSRFDNCMRLNLPKIANDKLSEIFEIWAGPRGLKMDYKDLIGIKTILGADIVTIYKLFVVINVRFDEPAIIKSKDINNIVETYEAKFLSQDFFDDE